MTLVEIKLGRLQEGDRFVRSATGVVWEVETVGDHGPEDNYWSMQCFAVKSRKPELMSNLYRILVTPELADARA